MSAPVAILLALGVAAAWLAAAASLRLGLLARIHAVGFLNVAAGGAVTLAAWLSDGPGVRSGKVLLAWVVLLVTGALAAHVTGRALHLRGGGRL